MNSFGVTPAGFVPKQQQQIITELNAAITSAFGGNVNLGAESVFGQLVGIFSEREALIWLMLEAVYASQYPGGAEGTSVDNILALSNLKRLNATPTVTNPTPAQQTNGIVLYGLVLYGTPGTVIPAGTQISTTTVPRLTFTTDAAVTIGSASSAEQTIVFSNVPTQGSFALSIQDAAGNILTTPPISYEADAYVSQLFWPMLPSMGTMTLMAGNQVLPPIDPTYSTSEIQSYLQALGGNLSGASVSGGIQSSQLIFSWAINLLQPIITANPTLLEFSAAPTAGSFALQVAGVASPSFPYNVTAPAIQAALVAMGYAQAQVGACTPILTNLFPGNVRTGTDASLSTVGFSSCNIGAGYALAAGATLASTQDQAWEESSSLQVSCAPGATYGACVRAPVQAGTQYTFSAYARSVSGSISLTPAIWYNVSGGGLGSPVTVNDTGWTRISMTVTVPSGQTVGQFAIGESSDASAQFYLDGWQLEKAASASAWTDTGGIPGFGINWGAAAPPSVSVAANSLTAGGAVSLSAVSGYGFDKPVGVANSMQSLLSNLYDPITGKKPYTDILVLDNGGTQFVVQFGLFSPAPGQPSSANMPQATLAVAANSLLSGSSATNVAIVTNAPGAQAQAVATATCTQNGPNVVLAGQLAVIGSPISGWSGVTNQLDCLPGRNTETDTQALLRRSQLAALNAQGPLQSIVAKVLSVAGVTTAIGFQNTGAAALQILQFGTQPTTGNFALVLGGGVTALIPYNASAGQIQEAISAVPTYSSATVTGSSALGFLVDFADSWGGQPQPLIQVTGNTTGVAITTSYGRAPKSFEIVVSGGAVQDIARTIYDAMPAGIASYGTPAAEALGTMTQGSASLSVNSAVGIGIGQAIFGAGAPPGATVVGISGTTITMSGNALSAQTATPVLFNWSASVLDSYGNPQTVSFSRPIQVLIYMAVHLVTDQYRSPGDPSSGINPQSKWSPGSVGQIQADLQRIGNSVPIGGMLVAAGTNGLVGAFNEVPGIVGYTLYFDSAPNPIASANIQLLPTQVAVVEQFNIAVSWS